MWKNLYRASTKQADANHTAVDVYLYAVAEAEGEARVLLVQAMRRQGVKTIDPFFAVEQVVTQDVWTEEK